MFRKLGASQCCTFAGRLECLRADVLGERERFLQRLSTNRSGVVSRVADDARCVATSADSYDDSSDSGE